MKRLLAFVFVSMPFCGFCQICLKIDSLLVTDMIEVEPSNMIVEQYGEGPFLKGYFTLSNNTPVSLSLKTSNYTMYYAYCYDKELYTSLYLHPNWDDTGICVNPGDSIKFACGARLMIDMNIKKSKRTGGQDASIIDHSDAFYSILPTLYAEIAIGEHIFVSSSIDTWTFEYLEGLPPTKIKIYPCNTKNISNGVVDK